MILMKVGVTAMREFLMMILKYVEVKSLLPREALSPAALQGAQEPGWLESFFFTFTRLHTIEFCERNFSRIIRAVILIR